MAQNDIQQHRRRISMAYMFMFLALFTILSGIIAYFIALKVSQSQDAEVWIQAQALWIMRSVILFFFMAAFAALWFIPLFFFEWNASQWVTGVTVAGVVFAFVAWMYFLNCFINGLSKYLKNKAVF
ncbi:MAG: hypothetical protein QM666_03065 [Acinetobacter sp.]